MKSGVGSRETSKTYRAKCFEEQSWKTLILARFSLKCVNLFDTPAWT